jgi:solute carrier family 35 protein E1
MHRQDEQEIALSQTVATQKKGVVALGKITMLTILWYSTSVIAVVTSKEVLLFLPFPITLCLVQFLTAGVLLSTLTKYILKSPNSAPSLDSQNKLSIVFLKRKLAIAYTLGFILTNFAYQVVAPSFVESVKAAEPVTTALLSYLILGEFSSYLTYLTLLPVCVGVTLACQGKQLFSLSGLVLSLASNLCFSGRSVYAKQFYASHTGSGTSPVSGLSLFCDISLLGVVFLIPLSAIVEWSSIWILFTATDTNTDTDTDIDIQSKEKGFTQVPFYLVCNCLAYTVYNCVSFLILAETTALNHGVLNALRRISTIGFATFYFNVSMTLVNQFGVVCTVMGALMYTFSK